LPLRLLALLVEGAPNPLWASKGSDGGAPVLNGVTAVVVRALNWSGVISGNEMCSW